MSETMKPKQEWLSEYSKESTKYIHSKNFDFFLEWAKTSDVELVQEYKNSEPHAFAKKWGKKVVQYYNYLVLKRALKTNTARSMTIAARAFFKSQCIEVKIKRGAIAKAKIAVGEHEFTQQELQRMFSVGNIEDKAKLSPAITLGYGVGDFILLKWDFIEPYLAENLEAPIGFWYERHKTGAPSRSHLTKECVETLRLWRETNGKTSDYIFAGRNGNPLTEDALSDWLRSLAKRASIQPRGKIRFHLIRKFLFSQLSSSGMNQWEACLSVGKTVPSDILTYLKNQAQNLREKFLIAQPRFSLTTTNLNNHSKLERLDQIVTQQDDKIKMLLRIIEKAIPQERQREIIQEIASELGIDMSKGKLTFSNLNKRVERKRQAS